MCKGPVVCREEDAEPSRNQKEASVAAIKLIIMQSRGGGLWGAEAPAVSPDQTMSPQGFILHRERNTWLSGPALLLTLWRAPPH